MRCNEDDEDVINDKAQAKTAACSLKAGGNVASETMGVLRAQVNAYTNTGVEQCAVCQKGDGMKKHQEIYNKYTDASVLSLTIDSVVSTALTGEDAGKFDSVMTVTIKKNGVAFIDVDELPLLKQKRFYTVVHDAATRTFDDSQSFSKPVAVGNGVYTLSAKGMKYAPDNSNAQAYGYIADETMDTEGMTLYGNVASGAKVFGDAGTYESLANVDGCTKCHGTPYMKHGYRDPVVPGLGDFSSCKSCHYDTKKGGHQDWQILLDDPARYAEMSALAKAGAEAGDKDKDRISDHLTDEEKTKYAYKAKLMKDVHMAHSMEFPYPQSMANCVTCHEGKIDKILDDKYFTVETCKSCHVVTGSEEHHTADNSLTTIWKKYKVDALHKIDSDCASCHKAGGDAKQFSAMHTGYNKKIYADNAGTRIPDLFKVTVDSASFAKNILTVEFSATEDASSTMDFDPADIVPTVLIGLYGYDTKDFIVDAHGKDKDGNRLLEFPIDGKTKNPRFKVVSAADGKWKITADLSMWADRLANGSVKRAEIGIMPALTTVVGEKDSRDNK